MLFPESYWKKTVAGKFIMFICSSKGATLNRAVHYCKYFIWDFSILLGQLLIKRTFNCFVYNAIFIMAAAMKL